MPDSQYGQEIIRYRWITVTGQIGQLARAREDARFELTYDWVTDQLVPPEA